MFLSKVEEQKRRMLEKQKERRGIKFTEMKLLLEALLLEVLELSELLPPRFPESLAATASICIHSEPKPDVLHPATHLPVLLLIGRT